MGVCRTVGVVGAGHRLHAAQLDAVAAFDTAGLAAPTRHRTTRRWLEHRAGCSVGQAAGLVCVARATRDHLPATREAAAAGQISAADVAAITGRGAPGHRRAAGPPRLPIGSRYPSRWASSGENAGRQTAT